MAPKDETISRKHILVEDDRIDGPVAVLTRASIRAFTQNEPYFACDIELLEETESRTPELEALLRDLGVTRIIVTGLATDYCVKATAIDAVAAGYKVTVIEGLSKGVAPDTTAKALEEMKAKGIIIKADVEM